MVQLSGATANVFCTPAYYVIICAISLTGEVSLWWLPNHCSDYVSFYAMFDHKDCL